MNGDVLGQALAVIAVAMVALGPYVRVAVDGIKATKRIRKGYAGVVALAVGVVVGAVIGCLAWIDGASARWLLVGAVAGFFAGVAAIQAEHAAVGRASLQERAEPSRGLPDVKVRPASMVLGSATSTSSGGEG